MTVRNGSLDVTGRLLLLNSITLTPDTEKGFPMLTADVSAASYLLPATEGLTAGATADSPTGTAAPARPADAGAERSPATTTTATISGATRVSILNDTWRFLVQRRLWPVAILLLAAAVAVPMLLSEDPAPAPPPARWRSRPTSSPCSRPIRS